MQNKTRKTTVKKNKEFYDRQGTETPKYKVGDLVFLKRMYHNSKLVKGKFLKPYIETPFFITQVSDKNWVRLRSSVDDKPLKNPVNVDRLKMYHCDNDLFHSKVTKAKQYLEQKKQDLRMSTDQENDIRRVTNSVPKRLTQSQPQLNENDVRTTDSTYVHKGEADKSKLGSSSSGAKTASQKETYKSQPDSSAGSGQRTQNQNRNQGVDNGSLTHGSNETRSQYHPDGEQDNTKYP